MYWFVGGDRRAYWTVDYLRKKGLQVYTQSVPGMEDSTLPEIVPVLLLPFPIPRVWEEAEETSCRVGKNSLVLGGCFRGYRELFISKGANVVELCDREPLVTVNAVGTVEGALSLMIRESDITLWESKALVIGGGRIGMLLGERLRDLGVRVTVAVRSPKDRGKVRTRAMGIEETGVYAGGLEDYDFVINTVPAPVLDREQLSCLKKDCLLIELASAPGGFSPQGSEALGIRTLAAPGLPGRFSPKTAGILYGECLLEALKEERAL